MAIVLNQLTKGWIPPPAREQNERYRVFLVHAHPLGEKSFSGAIAASVKRGLTEAGHQVVYYSLYEKNFEPRLSKDERARYLGPTKENPNLPKYPKPVHDLSTPIAELQKCDALVLVYPTWWFNVPAILKGFFDRCFLPGIAFKLPHLETEDKGSAVTGLIPGLPNIKRLGIVTTFGASRPVTFFAGDNGTNMICRSFLPLLHPYCSVFWHGLYDLDTTSHESRTNFLDKVYKAYRDVF